MGRIFSFCNDILFVFVVFRFLLISVKNLVFHALNIEWGILIILFSFGVFSFLLLFCLFDCPQYLILKILYEYSIYIWIFTRYLLIHVSALVCSFIFNLPSEKDRLHRIHSLLRTIFTFFLCFVSELGGRFYFTFSYILSSYYYFAKAFSSAHDGGNTRKAERIFFSVFFFWEGKQKRKEN